MISFNTFSLRALYPLFSSSCKPNNQFLFIFFSSTHPILKSFTTSPLFPHAQHRHSRITVQENLSPARFICQRRAIMVDATMRGTNGGKKGLNWIRASSRKEVKIPTCAKPVERHIVGRIVHCQINNTNVSRTYKYFKIIEYPNIQHRC